MSKIRKNGIWVKYLRSSDIIYQMTSIIKVFSSLEKYSLKVAGLIQASGVFLYCLFIGIIFFKAVDWFGKMNNYIGPVLMLSLLSVSVLICALLTFGYPIILFWEEKKTKEAITLVAYTTAWMALYVILLMTVLIIF